LLHLTISSKNRLRDRYHGGMRRLAKSPVELPRRQRNLFASQLQVVANVDG
jgi:hypothetical protein